MLQKNHIAEPILVYIKKIDIFLSIYISDNKICESIKIQNEVNLGHAFFIFLEIWIAWCAFNYFGGITN